MRLLFVTPAYPPFPGGGERFVRSLALELAQRGHQLTIVTSAARREQDFWLGTAGRSPIVEQDGPLHILRCPLRPLPGGRPALLLWRKAMVLYSALPGDQTPSLARFSHAIPPIQHFSAALEQVGPFDLLHGFNISWEHPLVEGWRLARQRARPFVATPFAHLGVAGRDRVARNSTMDHQRRLLADAAAVLTLTSIERDGLIALAGLPPEQVTVIGSGCDPLPLLPDESAILRRYGLRLPLLLFVGRASHDKGAIHAAQAALALRRRDCQLCLALAGQIAPEFERFYRRLSAEEQTVVRPLGVLDEMEKHALLASAACLLLPSRTDSFGIVLLEAWQHGKPVIAARAGGIPAVVNDGEDGLLVEYGDVAALAQAMERLLTDTALRQTMGQTGRAKIAHQYTWAHVAGRVEKIYQSVIT
jgi:glycosyltransferase involved in cell wall biosynthesis